MKLLKLVTKNFKKLGNFSADFTDGLNVIVGENAQGKSTLLQAIEAALFGVTVVPGKKENIPTWGQTKFSLTLTFTNHVAASPEDDWYYCLTSTGSTAKLEKIGPGEETLLANGNTPVTKYIEELFGLTAKDFNLFVQSKQGETSGVLTFGATALNQKVEEFAGVSLIDDVAKRANELAAEQRAVISANEVDAEDLRVAQEDMKSATDRLATAETALSDAESALAAVRPMTLVLPDPSSQRLTELRRAADKHDAQLAAAKSELALKGQAVTLAEQLVIAAGNEVDVEDLEAQRKQVKSSAAALRRTVSSLNSELASAASFRKALEAASKAFAAAKASFSPELLDRATAAAQEAQELVKSASAQIAVIGTRIKDMQSLQAGATCPTCNSKLSDHDPEALAAEIAQLQAQLKSHHADKASADEMAKAEGSIIAAQTKAHDEMLRADAQEKKAAAEVAAIRPDIEADLESAGEQLAKADAELASLEAKLATAEEANDTVRAARRRLAKAEVELEEVEGLVRDLEALQLPKPTDVEIDAAAQAEAAYRHEQQEYARAKSLAESAVTMARAEVRSARDVLSYAEADLKRLQECAERVAAASLLADKAGRLSRFLRDRRQNYLQQIWQAVMGTASRQVATASRGLITRISNEGGEFTFEEDGVLAPIASASGAQKAFIGSAVRIGLARTLYGRDSLLIFDEPTESMSERNASGLAASLAGSANQLLLITHREQDQGLAANIIQVGA